MAMNRLKMLVAKRKADKMTSSTESSTDSESSVTPKVPEIPTWRKRMEARLKLGEAKAAHKSKTEELAALASNHPTGRSLTSSMSCSSGYESSNSAKYSPGETTLDGDDDEEATTPVLDKLSPFESAERDFERMESVDTIVNDDDGVLPHQRPLLDEVDETGAKSDGISDNTETKTDDTSAIDQQIGLAANSDEVETGRHNSVLLKQDVLGEAADQAQPDEGTKDTEHLEAAPATPATASDVAEKSEDQTAEGQLEENNDIPRKVNEATDYTAEMQPSLTTSENNDVPNKIPIDEPTEQPQISVSSSENDEIIEFDACDDDLSSNESEDDQESDDDADVDASQSNMANSKTYHRQASSVKEDESPDEEQKCEQKPEGSESEPEFLSDSDEESESSYRSDKPCYCPTDTLDDLVSAITARKNSNNSVRSNNSNRSNAHSIPSRANSNKVYDSDRASNTSINERMSDSQSEMSKVERSSKHGTPPKPKYASPRSSSGQNRVDVSKPVLHSSGSPVQRYKRQSSKTSSDRSCDSPSEPYLPENSRHRRVSLNSEDSYESSQTSMSRRRQSPATRFPLPSHNNGSEQDLSYCDTDYSSSRRQRWSQSPAHDLNTEQRRRARIAAICGEEYTPPPPSPPAFYDPNEERRIPIEIERSPQPDYDLRRRNRIASVLSNDSVCSDSALHHWRSRDPQPIRGRISHSPIRNEVECFGGAVKVRVRTSPARQSSSGYPSIRESPARGTSMDARRARIAAIMAEGDSTENLARDRVRESPRRSTGSQGYTSGTSQERRRARIAAIMSGSQESLNSEDTPRSPLQRVVGTTPPDSRSASRNNSDDARHRRIAAVLSGNNQ